ncbi:MAG: DUF5666 domain-containing protein [Patescibacteria group bacterium]|nr:DUF5666 domain-containing protein [Patescibacteria group bacterium]
MNNKMLIGFIIALVIVGGGAFYGGMLYGKSQKSGLRNFSGPLGQAGFGQAANGNGPGRNGANRMGGGLINGQIIAADDKSITVKLTDGGSKIILLSGETQISRFAAGSAVDLTVGQAVMASGTTNSDGSVTAKMIQLRPAAPSGVNSAPQQ